MVQVISKNKTHTTFKIANSVISSFFDIANLNSNKNIKPSTLNNSKKEYVEDIKEKKEIEKVKKDFDSGKFLTLKEFLLEN